MTEGLIIGLVVAAFAGLLGYVFGNKGTQQLKIDVAAIAPALAAIGRVTDALQSAVDSVAHGFVEHTRQPGHLGGLERLERVEKDMEEIARMLRSHIENVPIHHYPKETHHGSSP